MNYPISIENLFYKYPQGEAIFEGLNLSIEEGQFVILLGKNGSGKSTLINLMLGYRTPNGGQISIMGLHPKRDEKPIRSQMFFISHNVQYYENAQIKFLLENFRVLYPKYDLEKEQELLRAFEINPDLYLYQLSLGQKVRVQIIAALASNTPVVLIDEITAVLDPMTRGEFSKILVDEKKQGRTILMATNIPDDSKVEADKVLYISNGEIQPYEG